MTAPATTSSAANGTSQSSADGKVTFHAASGDTVMNVEIARTAAQRAQGLMGRTSLAPDAGMIFVWSAPTDSAFWMKDTPLPLSIAFIGKDGAIVDIQEMEAETTNPHVPAALYIYAVEANKGYYSQHGISPGDKADVTGI